MATGADPPGARRAPGGGAEFFVSYAAADEAWATWIAVELEAAGGSVRVQAWDSPAGENFVVWIGEQMQAARRTVAVCSPAYFASHWCTQEWAGALAGGKVIPLRVADCDLPPVLSTVGWRDLHGRDEATARRRLLEAVGLAEVARVASAGFPGARPAPFPGRPAGVGDAAGRRPAGLGQPVEELDDPFAFEVHPAIDAGARAAGLPVLPAYVPRDHDERLREVVRRVLGGSSAVAMLVGGSSTGKTRACWEAVKTLPAGWRLWHPINPGRPEAALAQLPRIGPWTVVWLNEAQHYLLTAAPELGEQVAAGLRELLRDPGRRPVLVLATVWPAYWAALATAPADGQPDPHAQARALLLGADVPVPGAFTGPALAALRAAVGGDPRLAEARVHAEQGQVTQYLAGAPALLARYGNAPPAARALIEAAMDARRLGHGPALPRALLEAAAPGYLSDRHWDALGDDWLDRALAYTAVPCRGARGPLTRIRPRPGQPGYGQPHYRLADYLEQHGRSTRRAHRAPAALWDALVTHATGADAARLAYSAESRLLYRYAIPLYRRAANTDDRWVADRLAGLLAERGDIDDAIQVLRAHADTGGKSAADRLAELLALRGDVDEAIEVLQARVGASGWDPSAVDLLSVRETARRLADLLARRGDVDGLRARADSGDPDAAGRLVEVLVERGDLDGLRARADAGDGNAAGKLAGLLARRGDLEGLRARADSGDPHAAGRLVEVLVERGDLDGLRARADAGDGNAAGKLAGLLARRGDVDGLRARADSGDPHAAGRLVEVLVERGDLDGLRARADAGDQGAAWRLADVLAERGDLDEAAQVVRACVSAGDPNAARELADVLIERGDLDGAVQLLRVGMDAGDGYAVWQLVDVLVERGDLDGAVQLLRAGMDAGDWYAASRLADVLVERGDLDQAAQILRACADSGDSDAASRLADVLVEHGDLDQAAQILRACADVGDGYASWRLIGVLVERGDIDGLAARVDASDGIAADWLVDLLVERGDLDDATQLLRVRAGAGDGYAACRLADVLAERGDIDGLRARADSGDPDAARRLVELVEALAERGDIDGLRACADSGAPDAAHRLAELLARRGDVDGLRACADSGAPDAARRLAELLARRGDVDGLRARADSGDPDAARQLVDTLAERGDVNEATQLLRASTAAGLYGWGAAKRLADLLRLQGRMKEAEHVSRSGINPDGSTASCPRS